MSSFGPQSMAVEQRCGSSGDGRCGVDDFDCGAGLVCDDLGQKRIMGAAEDDAVGARFYQRRDGPVYELSDGGRVFLASFDRFHEPLAYGRQYPDAGGVFAAQFARTSRFPAKRVWRAPPMMPLRVVAAAGLMAGSIPTKGTG